MKLDTIRKSYLVYMFAMVLIGFFGAFALILGKANFRQILGGYLIICVMCVAISYPIGISWWKQIDEAAREAHKTAWFWGGSIGMSVAVFIAALNLFFEGAILESLENLYRINNIQNFGFELGLLNVMTFMGLGYMIHWGIWWKSRMPKDDE